MVQAMIWSCLAMSLLLADIANTWMEMRSALITNSKGSLTIAPALPETVAETI